MKPNPSQKDDLTGLFNQKSFNEEFEAVLANAGEEPVALALIDIDNFKGLNDQYGHQAGDIILRNVAGIIEETAGDGHILSRYGGDEFGIIFINTEREQAFLLVERMRSTVQGWMFSPGDQLAPVSGITISGGVAAFPIDSHSSAEILRKADQALYRAKEAGRNKVRLAYEERMVPKTTHFTLTQLERLSKLANQRSLSEAELLREALDELLKKYGVTDIER